MQFFKLPFFVLLACIIICNACKNEKPTHKQEYAYIDSLDARVKTIDLAINSLNAQELKKRIDLVNTWYMELKDTSYEVAKKRQVDFNGFKVVYQKYIDSFFVYEAENSVLSDRITELKKQVKNETLSRADFKKEYATLKDKTNTLYHRTLSTTKPVNDLAFSWRRYAREMDETN